MKVSIHRPSSVCLRSEQRHRPTSHCSMTLRTWYASLLAPEDRRLGKVQRHQLLLKICRRENKRGRRQGGRLSICPSSLTPFLSPSLTTHKRHPRIQGKWAVKLRATFEAVQEGKDLQSLNKSGPLVSPPRYTKFPAKGWSNSLFSYYINISYHY